MVKLLLAKDDVDLNSKDTSVGYTPLLWAAKRGHDKVVELLIVKKGVNSEFKDINSRTPLSWAAGKGHKSVVKLLLEKSGADPNSRDKDGQMPLLWAAWKEHEAVMKLLLENNVDVDVEDNYGYTALQLAEFTIHKVLEQLLIEKGTSAPKDLWTSDFVSRKSILIRLMLNALNGINRNSEIVIYNGRTSQLQPFSETKTGLGFRTHHGLYNEC